MTQQTDWDIVTGVGLTALAVAAARSVETHRADPLVTDPYAEAFVRTAGAALPMPTRPAEVDTTGGENTGGKHDGAGDLADVWRLMATYLGVRSRFFDTELAAATGAGATQLVLLAAGLDTRAHRLDWPPGTVVYELDAPKVLEFKDGVLDAEGARPRADRRVVGVDLRDDWPAALRSAGFEPSRPTAWLAEGLLPFLPDDAKSRLFTAIHELSAPGSRIAAEHLDADVAELLDEPRMRGMADRFGFDLADLWPADQRFDPVDWLAGRGWTVAASQAGSVADRYQRAYQEDGPNPMRASLFISAHLPAH